MNKITGIPCASGIFFLSVFLPLFSFSQTELGYSSLASNFSDSSAKYAISAYGDGMLNSPVLTNSFFWQFNNKGIVTKEIKDEIAKNLKTDNRAGLDFNYGLYYSQKINSSWLFTINLADRVHLDARFPQDLFHLAFYGNRKFSGDTAILDNTRINYFRYQQIQSGCIKTYDNGYQFGAAVALLKGEENLRMELNRGRLFTAENGEQLVADFGFEMLQSDTASTGFSAFNGWGVGTDFFVRIPLKIKSRTSFVTAEINDLGFIRWNNRSLNLTADTSIEFEGIYVDNIFQLTDSVLQANSPDTLADNIQSATIKGPYYGIVPAYAKIQWALNAEKYYFSSGISYRLNANFTPYIFLNAGYRISRVISAATKIAYGGYGNMTFGLNVHLTFNKFSILLGTNTLEGILAPKYSGGNSGYLCVRKEF